MIARKPCKTTLLIALVGVLLPLAALAGDVRQAYPVVYELRVMESDANRLIATGDMLLMEGRTVTAEANQEDATDQPAVTLAIRTERASNAAERLNLEVNVDITRQTGQRRVEADNDSYIAGPDVDRIAFENEAWQNLSDPTPVQVRHRDGGRTYELRLLFQGAALR